MNLAKVIGPSIEINWRIRLHNSFDVSSEFWMMLGYFLWKKLWDESRDLAERNLRIRSLLNFLWAVLEFTLRKILGKIPRDNTEWE